MMKILNERKIIVAGGTGNVGFFLVKELLKRGADVAVPSRSTRKIEKLESNLAGELDDEQFSRLYTLEGNIGIESSAGELQKILADQWGTPDGVIASLGRFIPAPSLLDATADELRQVVDGYLTGHFVVARTFLPTLKKHGGTYIFINGPLALEPWEGSGAGLVSIATAGQQMLFKALAQELEDSGAAVAELISHAYIRNRETQPGSPVPGEAVGAFAAHLLMEERSVIHGKSIQLQSMEQLEQINLDG